ncbi:O-antigen ligase family protein [Methylocystis echinoides]|uniref:O-antigen ligase family protein n=1 Tax=Methylocystis echinoides TaxID=29468 RepID=UPI00342C0D1E
MPSSVTLAGLSAAEAPLASSASTERSFDRKLFAALIFGLAFAPFWLGSNRPIAWGLNAIYYGALAILYEAALLWSGRTHPVALRRIWFPAIAFMSVVVWSLLQIAPFMPESWRHPIWRMASDALGEPIAGAISVNPDLTVLAVTRLLTCGLVFWLSLQLCRSERRARAMVKGIALIGLGYAVYGILAFFVWPDTILWFDKEYYRDSVTSTFVNRNSYATYSAIGLVCSLVCALRVFQRLTPPGMATVGQRVAALIAAALGPGGFWIVCAFIIGAGLMLTGSRGGIASSLAGVSVFFVLAAIRGRKNPIFVSVTLLVMVSVVGVTLLYFGDFLAHRLNTNHMDDEGRLAVYALTWRAVLDAPWLGTGYGTFQDVFKMYRDATLVSLFFWDRAHNTYLELFQGLGFPVAIFFMLSVANIVGHCILGVKQEAVAPVAAVATSVVVCLHSFVDFSLQVQALALTWSALLGAGLAQSPSVINPDGSF